MFTKKGYITYITKNKPDRIITRDVLDISDGYYSNVLYLRQDNRTTINSFRYEPQSGKWFVPGRKDKYGESKWKEFEGKVLEFYFRIGYEYKNN